MPESVFEFHQLDKDVVFRVESRRCLRRFEVEGKPLLHPLHSGPLGQVKEEREVQHNRRGEDGIATEKVDFYLHRIAEPAEDVYVVPAFLVIAARWIVVDADDV